MNVPFDVIQYLLVLVLRNSKQLLFVYLATHKFIDSDIFSRLTTLFIFMLYESCSLPLIIFCPFLYFPEFCYAIFKMEGMKERPGDSYIWEDLFTTGKAKICLLCILLSEWLHSSKSSITVPVLFVMTSCFKCITVCMYLNVYIQCLQLPVYASQLHVDSHKLNLFGTWHLSPK